MTIVIGSHKEALHLMLINTSYTSFPNKGRLPGTGGGWLHLGVASWQQRAELGRGSFG